MSVPEQIATVARIESMGAANADRGTTQVKVFVEDLGLKQYATPLFIPSDLAAGLVAGQSYNMTLRRGRKKDGKAGSFASEYQWDWVPDGTPVIEAPPAPSDGPTPQQEASATTWPGGNTLVQPTLVLEAVASGRQVAVGQPVPVEPRLHLTDWDKHISIQRQVAAKAATEIYVAQLTKGLSPEWDEWYTLIVDRIENGPQAPTDEPAPEEATE